jgi:antitoxin VapB
MPLQIANLAVVEKVDRLAKRLGMTKTAAVECAVDQLLLTVDQRQRPSADRLDALAQLDRLPDRGPQHDPHNWDEHGLPK